MDFMSISKKGQVTIFIIISVLIVAAVGGIVYIESIKEPVESPEVKEIRSFVEPCLKSVSGDAVLVIGEQGGYYNAPENANYFLFFPRPYYIYETESLVPKKEFLEKSLGLYIEENIDICLSNFTLLKEKGYDVKKAGTNKATVRIDGRYNSVNFKTIIPISVTKGSTTSLVTDFSTTIAPVRFETLLKASNDIAISETRDPRSICMSCVNDIADKYDLNVTILTTDVRDDVIYIITDKNSNFSGFPFEYSFAARYAFPDCEGAKECLEALRQ